MRVKAPFSHPRKSRNLTASCQKTCRQEETEISPKYNIKKIHQPPMIIKTKRRRQDANALICPLFGKNNLT